MLGNRDGEEFTDSDSGGQSQSATLSAMRAFTALLSSSHSKGTFWSSRAGFMKKVFFIIRDLI